MTRKELTTHIFSKGSYLCVGLDSDIDKLPAHLTNFDDPQFEFNKQIIDVNEAKRLASNVDALNLALRGISNSDSRLR